MLVCSVAWFSILYYSYALLLPLVLTIWPTLTRIYRRAFPSSEGNGRPSAAAARKPIPATKAQAVDETSQQQGKSCCCCWSPYSSKSA